MRTPEENEAMRKRLIAMNRKQDLKIVIGLMALGFCLLGWFLALTYFIGTYAVD